MRTSRTVSPFSVFAKSLKVLISPGPLMLTLEGEPSSLEGLGAHPVWRRRRLQRSKCRKGLSPSDLEVSEPAVVAVRTRDVLNARIQYHLNSGLLGGHILVEQEVEPCFSGRTRSRLVPGCFGDLENLGCDGVPVRILGSLCKGYGLD